MLFVSVVTLLDELREGMAPAPLLLPVGVPTGVAAPLVGAVELP